MRALLNVNVGVALRCCMEISGCDLKAVYRNVVGPALNGVFLFFSCFCLLCVEIFTIFRAFYAVCAFVFLETEINEMLLFFSLNFTQVRV